MSFITGFNPLTLLLNKINYMISYDPYIFLSYVHEYTASIYISYNYPTRNEETTLKFLLSIAYKEKDKYENACYNILEYFNIPNLDTLEQRIAYFRIKHGDTNSD